MKLIPLYSIGINLLPGSNWLYCKTFISASNVRSYVVFSQFFWTLLESNMIYNHYYNCILNKRYNMGIGHAYCELDMVYSFVRVNSVNALY